MRWLLVAALLLCGCAAAPEKIGVFVPGSPPMPCTRLPSGSQLKTPDGRTFDIVGDVVIVPEAQWDFIMAALDFMQREVSRKPDIEGPTSESF